MKSKKKIVALLLVGLALIIAAILSFFAIKGSPFFRNKPKRYPPQVIMEKKPLANRQKITNELCKAQLDSDLLIQAYEGIAETIYKNNSEEIWFNTKINNDIFREALGSFLNDHPEVFWIDPESSYSYTEYVDSICYELNFTETGEVLENKRELLDNVINKIKKGAPDNADDYEVELYLNDYLAEHCVYDTDGKNKHTSYGALAQGRAVCDGYSHAFQLLCHHLGIDCTVIEGTSDFNNNADDGHMWNCISLNDNWYHVDVTWNDSTNVQCGIEHYFYLNLTEEEISRDHRISGDYSQCSEENGYFFNVFVPKSASDELNYFRLNLVTITDPDEDAEILAAMIEAVKDRQKYCAFVVDTDDFQNTCDNIINNYASNWLDSVNHFTGDNPKIYPSGKAITYADKKIIAIQFDYVA